ncbi:MAPEG family protein [Myxococcaceae bacterium JPH2]|nr:MAPEG family protein [Myxococcaceae bacterium JPH2]
MNDLLARQLLPEMLLATPNLKLYALCTVALLLKMQAVGVATGVVRMRRGVVTNAEDAQRKPGAIQVATSEHPDVERVQRAHRNDLENIPPFLMLSLLAVLMGAAEGVTAASLVVFTLARVGHSVTYVKGIQPWRSVSYGVGLLAQLVVMALVVQRAVS